MLNISILALCIIGIIQNDAHIEALMQGEMPIYSLDATHLSVATLTELLRSSDGTKRVVATRELFRRGESILAELQNEGAKQVATIIPSRLDLIYSLIKGLEPGHYRNDSFGIHVESGVTTQEVCLMGLRHGFILPDTERIKPGQAPTYYVKLENGRNLASVLKQILTNEPIAVTLNLNYYER